MKTGNTAVQYFILSRNQIFSIDLNVFITCLVHPFIHHTVVCRSYRTSLREPRKQHISSTLYTYDCIRQLFGATGEIQHPSD